MVNSPLHGVLIVLQTNHLLVSHLTQVLHHLHVLALNRVKLLLIVVSIATVGETANNLLVIVL